ncbi:MAG: hypothetical protein DRN35_03045 [Thermoplasmata archaeon]|nr:MAG: hypothetical protein DRN28_01935 [Thermoplasmata archaeon]RLF71108.1 MAG: hypothetical protein DRN35_03045 [Thermoplasmata archaeon]RLF73964.1 MAG: hypothetical protein DRN55_01765 [Thermoplasmata archaeon]HDD59702.1 hypothetical protein [Euryarchaeota archaeon]
MIARKTYLILINTGITGLLGLVAWYYVANYVPKGDVGVVYFAIAYLGLFSFISDMGFGAAHVKKVSEGKDLGRCVGTFLTVKLLLVAAYTGFVFLSLFLWERGLGRGFETPQHYYMIIMMLAYMIPMQLGDVGMKTFMARTEVAIQQLALLLSGALQLAFTIYVVTHIKNIYIFGSTWVFGALVYFTVNTLYLSRLPLKAPTRDYFRDYLHFALPLMLVAVLATLPGSVDKVMIQLFWNKEEVARYVGGQRFPPYLQKISAGLSLILFPTISALHSRNRKGEIIKLMKESERHLLIVLSPLIAAMVVLAEPIVVILGDIQYRDSAPVLILLAIWVFMYSVNLPYGQLIMGYGKTRISARVSILSVTSIVLLNLLFIPSDLSQVTTLLLSHPLSPEHNVKLLGLGAPGAALATLLSSILVAVYMRLKVRKLTGHILLPPVRPPVAALISGLIVYYLIPLIHPVTRYYHLVFYSLLLGGIYLGILTVMRGFTRKDLKFYLDTLHPGYLVRYTLKEIREGLRRG